MSNHPELDAAAERALEMLPSHMGDLIADRLADEGCRVSNDLAGLRELADEVMSLTSMAERDRQQAIRATADRELLIREKKKLLWLHAEAAWRVEGLTIMAAQAARLMGEAYKKRDEARDKFLDHYNATTGQLDRVTELETALRERTAERDRLASEIAGYKRVRDDVDALLIAALGPQAEPGGGGWFADVSQLVAERDETSAALQDRQARIEKTLSFLDDWYRRGRPGPVAMDAFGRTLRAILTGEDT